ncbi:MAG: hypothetical protein HYT68_01625 [Candidatus Zambryskibacteria bacterium]|nr:hypothetical protein [Candidatus Zambryskibacteria bacterium]
MLEKEKGLKNTTIALMVVTALFFDALQWFLAFIFMGWVVTIFAGLTFYLWFKLQGISFMKPKRLATFGGSFIIELIPILGDVLPAWTAAVVILVLDSKIKKVVPGLDIMKK